MKVFGIDLKSYDDEIERAVASFVYWSKIIESQNPDKVFRIEEGVSSVLDYCVEKELVEKDIDIILPVKKNINSGKPYSGVVHKNPCVDELDFYKIERDLLVMLNSYCEVYGYELF